MIGMIKRILSVSGKYQGRIYGAMGFSFLKGLLVKVPIILTYFIVTAFIDGTLTKKTAVYSAIALVASIIVQAVFQYIADSCKAVRAI
jgi:ATP-binding cassette subfamily B protein